MTEHPKDLVVLVPDKNMEASLSGLLQRCPALGIRQVSHDIYVHPQRDPGCYLRAQDFLRPFSRTYAHAMVLFDRMGCGAEGLPRTGLEKKVAERLRRNGWRNDAAAVVIDPELEMWVWGQAAVVAKAWDGAIRTKCARG